MTKVLIWDQMSFDEYTQSGYFIILLNRLITFQNCRTTVHCNILTKTHQGTEGVGAASVNG